MIPRARLVVSLASLLASAAAQASPSFFCDRGIVSLGATKLELLGKCGRPALVESRTEESDAVVTPVDDGTETREVTSLIETWTYDLGQSRRVRLVVLRDGSVADVRDGAYGWVEPARDGARLLVPLCDPDVIRVGARADEILARCGDPAAIDRRRERCTLRSGDADGRILKRSVTREIEVWSYDFGPDLLQRFVEVVDGQVTSVRTGGYGHGE